MRTLLIIRAAALEECKNRSSHFASIIFLALVLFVFSQLWTVISSEQSWNIAPATLIWYLAMTEVVVMCTPRIVQAMEQDLKTGRTSTLMVRPLGYFRQRLIEFCGQTFSKLLVLYIAAIFLSIVYSGTCILSARGLAVVFCLQLIAGFMAVVHQFTMGTLGVWLGDCTPLTWLYQKLLFVLGGLTVPLHYYPSLLQKIAKGTPFGAMLYGPASLLFEFQTERMWIVLWSLLAWTIFSTLTMIVIVRAAIKRLETIGG